MTPMGLATAKPIRQPFIKRKFEKIMLSLYRALIHSKGIYSIASIETHAPQVKYFPGSPALNREIKIVRQRTENLAGFMPTTEEVEQWISDFCASKLVLSPYVLQTAEKEISAVELSATDREQLNRLQNLLKKAQELEGLKSEVYTSTKTLERGGCEHLRWLWFATLTDRREKSDRVYRAHCRIYEEHPEFYSKEVTYIGAPTFRTLLKKRRYPVGSPSQSAGFWQICAFTLFSRFDGDPIKLLKETGWSVESVYAWKQSEKKRLGYDPIPGWGRKLLSLYFMYLAELGYPLPEDAFPADVHAQAILIQTGSLDYGDRDVIYSQQVAEMMRVKVTDLCRRKDLDPVIMAHASWIKGSELCTKCSSTPEAPNLCAIYTDCRGRVDTSPYFAQGRWPKTIQIMTKGGTRPKYGLPTDVQARLKTRKRGKPVSPTSPLFG